MPLAAARLRPCPDKAMFRLALLAEAAAADEAERIVRAEIKDQFEFVCSYHDHRMQNCPKNQRSIAENSHSAMVLHLRSEAPHQILDARHTACRIYRARWRRRHRWKLALLRVRAYLAMRAYVLDTVYSPDGGAGFKIAEESFARLALADVPPTEAR